MKSGVYYDLSMKEYLAVEALSASGVDCLIRSGKWGFYKEHLDPERERKETDALADGELLHTYILEPARFERECLEGPAGVTDKRARPWKDAVKAAEESCKTILTAETYKWLRRCKAEIEVHPFARGALLGPGHSEVSVFWSHAGIPCKARFDRLLPKIGIDLKKTRDASDNGFVREAWTYRYDVKAAWYLMASRAFLELGQTHFGFVAVEIGWPSLVNVFVYEPEDLILAEKDVQKAVELYRDGCINGWNRDDKTVKRLRLPGWVKQNDDNE